jgi:hypothetical protein
MRRMVVQIKQQLTLAQLEAELEPVVEEAAAEDEQEGEGGEFFPDYSV